MCWFVKTKPNHAPLLFPFTSPLTSPYSPDHHCDLKTLGGSGLQREPKPGAITKNSPSQCNSPAFAKLSELVSAWLIFRGVALIH